MGHLRKPRPHETNARERSRDRRERPDVPHSARPISLFRIGQSQAKQVWMIWQRDHMVRRIFLTDKHSESVTPSWFGESIGHYENGDTLVVDTIGLSTKNSYVDNFRTPHTEKEHVVERFKLSADGKMLEASVVVDDPDTFNAPLHMVQRWRKVKNTLLETVCAENNADFFHQNLFPLPEAEKADF